MITIFTHNSRYDNKHVVYKSSASPMLVNFYTGTWTGVAFGVWAFIQVLGLVIFVPLGFAPRSATDSRPLMDASYAFLLCVVAPLLCFFAFVTVHNRIAVGTYRSRAVARIALNWQELDLFSQDRLKNVYEQVIRDDANKDKSEIARRRQQELGIIVNELAAEKLKTREEDDPTLAQLQDFRSFYAEYKKHQKSGEIR